MRTLPWCLDIVITCQSYVHFYNLKNLKFCVNILLSSFFSPLLRRTIKKIERGSEKESVRNTEERQERWRWRRRRKGRRERRGEGDTAE